MTAWRMLLAAPHRGFFALGMVQGLWAMALWAADLGSRHFGFWSAHPWPLPNAWMHGLMLGYGVFSAFVFGFILTAGPRWRQQPEIPAGIYRPAMLLTAGGWLLADLWPFFPFCLPLGLAVAWGGWCWGTAAVWRLFLARRDDRLHIGTVALALTVGWLGLAGFVWLAAGGPAWLGTFGIDLMLWGYLLPLFATVMHRMLPFFSQSVIPGFPVARPRWPLWLLLAGSCGHGLLHLSGLSALTWLADLPAALAAFHLSRYWRFRASFRARILAVLHVGFAWLGLAFGLFGGDSLLRFAQLPGLGLAPLHALTIGCFTSLLIGMASRVTLGHSGRPFVGDRVMWACFWTMQAAAGLRLAAELVAPAANVVAALLWLCAFAVWAGHYGPAYWRPRQDGLPG